MSYIHANGICHCDLKPDNIFLDDIGLKIGDFGLARPIQTVRGEEEKLSGSGYNIAPEMYKCLVYSERSDLWALGCILFIMLTGAPPVIEGIHNNSALTANLLILTPSCIQATRKDILFTALCKCADGCNEFYELHCIDQFSQDKKNIINGLLHVNSSKRSTISAGIPSIYYL